MEEKKPGGIGKLLAKLLKEKETNVQEVSQATGVPATTLYSMIQRNSQSANVRDLALVARHLGVPLDYFSGLESQTDEGASAEETSWLAQMRDLDAHGREVVGALLDAEAKRVDASRLGPSFEVGLPSVLEGGEGCASVTDQQVDALKGGCRLLCVKDDSMAPEYLKGDILVMHVQPSVEIGHLGVFRLGGKVFFRKLANGALLASNPHYPPMLTPAATKLETLGKIVGKVRLPDSARI